MSRLYRWSDLPRLAGLALLYMLLANWTSGNLSVKGGVSVFWLPSGVALAGLLLGGIKYWPAVLVGSLAAVSAEGYPLWRQLGAASGNTLEALIGAWLLLRSDRFDVALRHAEDYLRIFLAGTAGACAGALTGIGVSLLAGRIAVPAVAGAVLRWYQGDILSILLLTPLILVWRRLPSGWFARARVVETIACFGLAGLLGQIAFVGWGHSVLGHPPLAYLAFLFVTWGGSFRPPRRLAAGCRGGAAGVDRCDLGHRFFRLRSRPVRPRRCVDVSGGAGHRRDNGVPALP
jgi:integral membrane sensor domain MASE1